MILTAQFYAYDDGPAADVTGLTIEIVSLDTDSTIVGPTATGISHPSTGLYTYDLDISGLSGSFMVLWESVDADASEIITVTGDTGTYPEIEVPYVTREEIQAAVGAADHPRMNARIDRANAAAAGELERFLHRRFYPWTGTRTFDVPTGPTLWLHDQELAGAPESISSGGTAMTSGDYFALPNSGPPYRWIDTNRAGSVPWSGGDTTQQAISITGTFFYPARLVDTTFLIDAPAGSDTEIDLDTSAGTGAGSLLLIDGERLLITDRTLITTGSTLTADLDASKSSTTFTVADGSLLDMGETLTIDGERMQVQSVAGNTVVVERSFAGSVLAAHTSGATIYAPRRCTVVRGVLGTVAAAHSASSVVRTILAPSLVREYALALAVDFWQQGNSAYSSNTGSADNRQGQQGSALAALAERVYTAYGRKTRSRAVGS